ncbi:MAG: hypothetical protein OFPI_32790 [Osedax symbiont Rs2]|nr:MAG: hypothetical protein OFPI_32790 [Osedax symbiont Rs2]
MLFVTAVICQLQYLSGLLLMPRNVINAGRFRPLYCKI